MLADWILDLAWKHYLSAYLCLWRLCFTSVSLTIFLAGHDWSLLLSCVQSWGKHPVAKRSKKAVREGFMDHQAGWVFLSSLKTYKVLPAKYSLVKTKQQATRPLKKRTSTLWNHGSCVLSSSLIGSRFENLLRLSEQLHVWFKVVCHRCAKLQVWLKRSEDPEIQRFVVLSVFLCIFISSYFFIFKLSDVLSFGNQVWGVSSGHQASAVPWPTKETIILWTQQPLMLIHIAQHRTVPLMPATLTRLSSWTMVLPAHPP